MNPNVITSIRIAIPLIRYKCIALNKAGNSSVEYLLRVVGQSSAPDGGSYIPSRDVTSAGSRNPATRDQRAQQAIQQHHVQQQQQLEMANKARILAAQTSQMTTETNTAGGSWLKSTTAFQITIVVVSALMAVVIIAFILFCVSIYQIKPSFAPGSLFPMQNQQWKDANGRTTILSSPADHTMSPLTNQQFVAGMNGRSTLEPFTTNQAQPLYGIANQSTPLLSSAGEPAYGRTPVHLVLNQAAIVPTTTVKLIDNDGFSDHRNHGQAPSNWPPPRQL